MNPLAEAVRSSATRVIEAGAALWDAGPERRARWLASAFAALNDSSRPEHVQRVLSLGESSGLSEPMVRWALSTTLDTLTEPALLELWAQAVSPSARAVPARPGRMCAVVLSGNVCTAAARALAVPLMFGWPVLAKASSRDDVLAWHLAQMLGSLDAELGAAVDVLTCPSEETSALTALLEQCDALSAFGSDATLNDLRAALGATATFVGHGNGLGLAIVGRAALESRAQAVPLARRLALDVAAYDQRGCLSPHAVLVEDGASVSPADFAELLFREGLAELATGLPRGALPLDVGGAQLSWRGVAAARGVLHEGDGYAVSFEANGGIRLSPGHRNVQVLGVRGLVQLPRLLAPFGVHLKCLAVAGVPLEAVARALPARVAPRLCEPGTMQTPRADGLADGLGNAEGFVRWLELDRR